MREPLDFESQSRPVRETPKHPISYVSPSFPARSRVPAAPILSRVDWDSPDGDAVDPTDYKEHILPLVYYKSISDEFETQYAQNVEEYGVDYARRPNLYDIPVVPEGYLWDDLRAVNDNVDQALNEAFDALTDANPDL